MRTAIQSGRRTNLRKRANVMPPDFGSEYFSNRMLTSSSESHRNTEYSLKLPVLSASRWNAARSMSPDLQSWVQLDSRYPGHNAPCKQCAMQCPAWRAMGHCHQSTGCAASSLPPRVPPRYWVARTGETKASLALLCRGHVHALMTTQCTAGQGEHGCLATCTSFHPHANATIHRN